MTCRKSAPCLNGTSCGLSREEEGLGGKTCWKARKQSGKSMVSGARKTCSVFCGQVSSPNITKVRGNGTNRKGLLRGLELNEMKDINPLTYTERLTSVSCNCKRT